MGKPLVADLFAVLLYWVPKYSKSSSEYTADFPPKKFDREDKQRRDFEI